MPIMPSPMQSTSDERWSVDPDNLSNEQLALCGNLTARTQHPSCLKIRGSRSQEC